MAIISEFYKRLRDLCEERNMTINELVRILNLSSGSPTAWKGGAIPRTATLVKIADYFGVSTAYLKGEENKKAPTGNGERDILDDVDVAFYGDFKELNDDQKETVRDMVRLMRQREKKRSQ